MTSITIRSRTPIALLALAALAASQPAASAEAMPASAQQLEAAAKSGARIYYTAVSDRGTPIRYTGGPDLGAGMMGGAMMGGAMMGGTGPWLTCASCHGPQARGGVHVMHMRAMYAPDIRFGALANMAEMKGRAHAYDLDDFRKSIEKGRHPDGDELNADMPRWQMSDADMSDLFAFLKSLPK